MNNKLFEMINRYNVKNNVERENAIKEVFQEIVLAALSKSDYFTKVAFHGGTAGRIFYNIDRFSEDLDFAFIGKGKIDINNYTSIIISQFKDLGIDVEISKNLKDNEVQTIFISSNERKCFNIFYPECKDIKEIFENKNIKVKVDIDTNNPYGANCIDLYRHLPFEHKVKVFDINTLFSGKVAALLCRKYKNRVKGRDFYDYLFYVNNNVKFNLNYLQNKLINSKKTDRKLTFEEIKELLKIKFNEVNYNMAIEDVIVFVKDDEEIRKWNKETFIKTIDLIQYI